jgi:hypothetical protein
VNRLEEINQFPDLLIADIHPNNAAKEILFQNDIIAPKEGHALLVELVIIGNALSGFPMCS